MFWAVSSDRHLTSWSNQWIWRLSTFMKNFQKVWFENAWELTFQTLFKSASESKVHMKTWFSSIFSKKLPHLINFLQLFNNKHKELWLNPTCPSPGKNFMHVLSKSLSSMGGGEIPALSPFWSCVDPPGTVSVEQLPGKCQASAM